MFEGPTHMHKDNLTIERRFFPGTQSVNNPTQSEILPQEQGIGGQKCSLQKQHPPLKSDPLMHSQIRKIRTGYGDGQSSPTKSVSYAGISRRYQLCGRMGLFPKAVSMTYE
jgi:hypothetical protein